VIGTCIHCGRALTKKTKDHVFPKSWYPENTPDILQRWTAPSCAECNGRSGERERELFIRLALCVDPRKAEVEGLSKRAVRSFGIGAEGISEDERRAREALKKKILSETRPYSANTEIFPGLGPHPGFERGQQNVIAIPETLMREVAKKIVRGCEYELGSNRIVGPPYELSVYFVPESKIGKVLRLFSAFGPVQQGPGFQVQRAGVQDDPLTVLYRIKIWGAWTIYASIMKGEENSEEK